MQPLWARFGPWTTHTEIEDVRPQGPICDDNDDNDAELAGQQWNLAEW